MSLIPFQVKGYFPPLSPNNSINADELVGAASGGGSSSMDDSEAGPSTSTPTGNSMNGVRLAQLIGNYFGTSIRPTLWDNVLGFIA